MDNLTAIALLLSYWLTIGLLAQWCAKKALTIRTAFLLGAAACICIAVTVMGVSSIYHSQLMLVSNSIEMTAFLFIALALMGGWRCTDKIRREKRAANGA